MRNFINNRQARFDDIPDNLGTDRCRQKIDAILNDPEGYKVTNEYNHGDVRTKLKTHHGIKCIYCEASPISTSSFRIDHFRPKKYIKELSKDDHNGYYWLAYEWTNFLQSCQFCNGAKSNHFPLFDENSRINDDTVGALLDANRTLTSSPLNDEKRYLLHPELDTVEDYFLFNENGVISSKTLRGKKSIRIYDLNRGDLVFWRKKIRDNYFKEIKELCDEYIKDVEEKNREAINFLRRGLFKLFRKWLFCFKEQGEYSLFHYFLFDKFKEFFVVCIKEIDCRVKLLELYEEYMNLK